MFQVIKKNCRRLAVYYNFWLIDRTRAGVPARGFPPHPKALVTASRIIVAAAGVSLRKYIHTYKHGAEKWKEVDLTKVNYTTKAPSVCFLNPNQSRGCSAGLSQLL
jgi:hypothetical protein